jgi:hypothetical protein
MALVPLSKYHAHNFCFENIEKKTGDMLITHTSSFYNYRYDRIYIATAALSIHS